MNSEIGKEEAKLWTVLEDMNLYVEPQECTCRGRYDHQFNSYQLNQTYYNNCIVESGHHCICQQLLSYLVYIPAARKLCRAEAHQHECSCCYYSDARCLSGIHNCLADKHRCTCIVAGKYCRADEHQHVCLCRRNRENNMVKTPFCQAIQDHICRCRLVHYYNDPSSPDLGGISAICRCGCRALEHQAIYVFNLEANDYVQVQNHCRCEI